MIILDRSTLRNYIEAGKIATQILSQVRQAVAPGVFPIELEEIAQEGCRRHQVTPAFASVNLGYGAYGYALCVSVNQVVLHGIPSRTKPLQSGDVVKLDFGIIYQGLHTDQCVTVGVQKLNQADQLLINSTREAVQSAVSLAITGNTTGDLGAMMQQTAYQYGLDVLKDYVGHGIGLKLHEQPTIPAYGHPNSGSILKEGMVICIEAQLVAGSDQVEILPDHWTIQTKDQNNAAMFEYMVMVSHQQPLLLTDTYDWPVIVK